MRNTGDDAKNSKLRSSHDESSEYARQSFLRPYDLKEGEPSELAREVEGLARVVDALAKEHAQTRGQLNQIIGLVSRGLWGRLTWLLFRK